MKRILDLGSGEGYLTYLLSKKKGNKVIGVDLSPENVKTSKKRYPKVTYKVMNCEKMSFKSNYFDEAYAMDVLEHVDNLDKVLKETHRVLKKGGRFFVNVPYYKSEYWLLKVRPTYHKEIHHVRIFKKGQLRKIMKKHKFSTVKEKNTAFLQHVLLYYLFRRKIKSNTQTSIGSWRDNYKTKTVFAFMLLFDPFILNTPLKYFPIWIITVPIGMVINFFGNKIFPRSVYFEFEKD